MADVPRDFRDRLGDIWHWDGAGVWTIRRAKMYSRSFADSYITIFCWYGPLTEVPRKD